MGLHGLLRGDIYIIVITGIWSLEINLENLFEHYLSPNRPILLFLSQPYILDVKVYCHM
jgi:hypothetical protein